MKNAGRWFCRMLSLAMAVCLSAGCGSAGSAGMEHNNLSDYEAMAAALNVDEAVKPELVRALQLRLPMDKAEQTTVSGAELAELLDKFVEIAAPDKLTQWQSKYPVLRSETNPLCRFDVMAGLFLAANFVGGAYENVTIQPYDVADTLTHNWDEDYLTWDLYGDWEALSAFECGLGETSALDSASYYYMLGRISGVSGEYPFAIDSASNSLRVKEDCTYAEAVLAVLRLLESAEINEDGRTFEKTDVQRQPDRYLPMDEVGAYNTDIITPELMKNCTLQDMDKAALPYLTGYVLENKIFVNQEYPSAWADYTAGSQYFCEEEIRYLAENGFQCARVLYSFSFLSNPEDLYSINVAELEQLDELIAWGMKYNVHIMLSITGLPGMWNTSREREDPVFNFAVFSDADMQAAFTQYWEMLSKRYADIPNGVLSFELIAEPGGVAADEYNPDVLVNRYCEVLEPIALSIWNNRADRIVIVMDITKYVPERLAEIGCCLSLHNHIYTTDERRLEETYGFETEASWPMQFMPGAVDGTSGAFSLTNEAGFEAGTFRIRAQWYWEGRPVILCDGKAVEITETFSEGNGYESYYIWEAAVPAGTKSVSFAFEGDAGCIVLQVELNQPERTILIPTHGWGAENSLTPRGRLPVITVAEDGRLSSDMTLDGAYIYDIYVKPFTDCAEKYGVSFLMTEVSNDTLSLSVEEYIEYNEVWLKLLREHGIGWMYNCVHNILGPRSLIWHNGLSGGIPFENFSRWEDTCYSVNDDIMNLLKKYSK